ncbi:MAG: 6-phospho-beta-glucosidase [Jatrophihabitantaceae bacterium]
MRLTILGGGGFRVPLIYRELIRRPELGVDELVLADPEPARLAVIGRIATSTASLAVRLTGSLAEAVAGADFVFSAVRVGGPAGRAADERRAVRAGLLGQETVGAGGLGYALRTLPVTQQIARTVAELAPDAWLINFTNPAGLITEASRIVLADRVIGICDSPAGLVSRAGRALGRPPEGLLPDYLGINHLGWLRALRAGPDDLLPGLIDDPDRLLGIEEGRLFGASMIRQLRAIPNEYLYFYYHSRELAAAQQAGTTRGELVRSEQDAFYAAAGADPDRAPALWEKARLSREQSYLAEARSDEREVEDLAGGGYERVALRLLRSLAGGPIDQLILNVANGTTVDQLPADLVIETNCVVDGSGARPLPTAPANLHQLGLMAGVRAAERAVIEASRTGSYDTALFAFTSHPLIASEQAGRQLLDDLLASEPGLLTGEPAA